MNILKKYILFPVTIGILFLSGLSLECALASSKKENEKVDSTLERACNKDEYYFDRLPNELREGVFSFLCNASHKATEAYLKSSPGQEIMEEALENAYGLVTPNNLKYSIPPREEIKNTVAFKFIFGVVEERLIKNHDTRAPYVPIKKDVEALGNFLLELRYVDTLCFQDIAEVSEHPHITHLFEKLAKVNLRALQLSTAGEPTCEQHFVNSLWPCIKKISSLRSLKLDIENVGILNTLVREITSLDLPLEELTLGFFDLKGELADGIALLVANSSHLKKLKVHDIGTDEKSLDTIMISVVRKHGFKKFRIGLKGDSNDFGIEDSENSEEYKSNTKKHLARSNKFKPADFDDILEYIHE